MTDALENLRQILSAKLGDNLHAARIDREELTVEITLEGFHAACLWLRDDPACRFDMLIDVCGVDYLSLIHI